MLNDTCQGQFEALIYKFDKKHERKTFHVQYRNRLQAAAGHWFKL